jgi:hypothetical protein
VSDTRTVPSTGRGSMSIGVEKRWAIVVGNNGEGGSRICFVEDNVGRVLRVLFDVETNNSEREQGSTN